MFKIPELSFYALPVDEQSRLSGPSPKRRALKSIGNLVSTRSLGGSVSTAKKEAQTPVTTKKSKTRAKSSSTLSVADKTTCETKISRRSTFAQQDEAGVTATTARVTKEVDAARSVGVANPVFSRAQKHVVHEIAEDARAPVKRLRRRSPVEEPKKSVFAESSQFDYDDVTPAAEERTSAVSEPLSTSAGDWKPTVNVSGFVTPREEAAKRINDVIACAPPVSPLDTPTTAVAPLEENYWCCDDGCKNIIVVTAEVCSQCQLHWSWCVDVHRLVQCEICNEPRVSRGQIGQPAANQARKQPPWQCHICGCDNESSWEQVRDVRCLLSRNNSRCAVHAVRVHERHDR